jgi:hypothetical protein
VVVSSEWRLRKLSHPQEHRSQSLLMLCLWCVWLVRQSPRTECFCLLQGAISSRMPTNSCATFWTTYTWNSRAASMVFPAHQFYRRILLCLQVTSAACKVYFPFAFRVPQTFLLRYYVLDLWKVESLPGHLLKPLWTWTFSSGLKCASCFQTRDILYFHLSVILILFFGIDYFKIWKK